MAQNSDRPVIFDVGNVLLHWDPNPLIDALAASPEDADHIRNTVITHDWNAQLDAGKTWGEGCAELAADFPAYAALVHEYNARWEETIHGEVDGTPDLLMALHEAGTPLYALTNFSSEKFQLTRPKYAFFDVFRDILVSGDEKLIKPDPAIYHLIAERNGLNREACVFIDDSPANVEGARSVGMTAIHFTSAPALRVSLADLGIAV